jgi:hypothetical protein
MPKLRAAIVAALAVLALPASAAAARPATPELIQAAQQRGTISAEKATLLRAYALAAPRKLPAAYRSATPWDGTLTLLRVHRALPKLARGRARTEAAQLAGPSAAAVTSCDVDSSGDLPDTTSTTNFWVQYDATALDPSLTISQYATSLQNSWTTEVGTFGWAAPPLKNTPGGVKYHVRVDALADGLYGYVSNSGTYAGFVGNNPNTAWNEGDSYATCMVLNDDYTGFPSTPQNSLDATTAHEFNHSLQYGYGGLTGSNAASESFTEGGASWMEDEVYDASNDNYNYLWPDLRQSMATYQPDFAYPYWVVFRGISERYGPNTAGGAEDVMQDFWERTSKNEAGNLNSMEQAVADKGASTLPAAFQDFAVAMKFSKSCGGGNGSAPPDCFQEGASYASAAGGRPASDTSIGAVPGSASDTVADAYATQYTSLPASGPYGVRLTNTSPGGQLRATVACNPGSGSALRLEPLPGPLAASQSGTLDSFDPAGCSSPVLVTTNSAHTSANPSAPADRSMQVQTFVPGSPPATPPGGGTTNPPPAGGATTTAGTGQSIAPALDVFAPKLGRPRLSASRFRASPGRGRRPPVGTRLRYSLSEAAKVSFRVERKRGKRWRKVGSFSKRGRKGSNLLRFNGRLRHHKLRAGTYRFVLLARDAAGNVSVTRRKTFRIVTR